MYALLCRSEPAAAAAASGGAGTRCGWGSADWRQPAAGQGETEFKLGKPKSVQDASH